MQRRGIPSDSKKRACTLRIATHATFAAGLILGPALLALLVLNALARTYRGLDAIEDSPR